MEPEREAHRKALEPGAEPKPKRFRIVKLEERIAPGKGGNGTHNGCNIHSSLYGCGATDWCTVSCVRCP
jgi:hypothetical protein